VKRRRFLAAIVLLPAARSFATDTTPKRVAILTLGGAHSIPSILRGTLERATKSRGFTEGHNLEVVVHYAQEDVKQLAAVARGLVTDKVDVIYAVNTPAAVAARRATSGIPIVFVRVADPIRVGLVKSFANPGTNVTGVVPFTPELAGKRLEIFKQALPRTARIAVLWASANEGAAQTFRQFQEAGAKLGIGVHDARINGQADVDRVMTEAARSGCDALMLIDDVLVVSLMSKIVHRGLAERLPVAAIYRQAAEAGALMSYGPNVDEIYEAAADYVARILDGAKPADLPVRQPARFDLVLNLKAAKALNLRLPENLLAAAHKVIT